MTDLQGKVAIVTGAAAGIGLSIAGHLAEHGAKVLVCDVTDPQPAVEALRRNGLVAEGLVADISDIAAVQHVVDECARLFGGLDILVNNAGLFTSLTRGPFEALDVAEWKRVIDVNVTGPYLFCRAALPLLRRSAGGRIINITSATIFSAPPGMLHYVTSKGGLTAMTRSLARELGVHGITVNAVAPGFTLSSGVVAQMEGAFSAQAERARSNRAIARDQAPEDLCGAVTFLAGQGSSFVTGQTLVVDGGTVMH